MTTGAQRPYPASGPWARRLVALPGPAVVLALLLLVAGCSQEQPSPGLRLGPDGGLRLVVPVCAGRDPGEGLFVVIRDGTSVWRGEARPGQVVRTKPHPEVDLLEVPLEQQAFVGRTNPLPSLSSAVLEAGWTRFDGGLPYELPEDELWTSHGPALVPRSWWRTSSS